MPATPSPVRCADVIVFEGDSLSNRRMGPSFDTWPFLELMNWHESWGSMLARWLFATRPELRLGFHNAAVGGSNCRSWSNRYEEMVKPHKPAWVCFTLGTNDAALGVTPSEITRTVRAYAEWLRADSGGRLCYVKVGQRVRDVPEDQRPLQRKRLQLWCSIAKTVEAEGGLVVDCLTPMAQKQAELKRQCELHSIYSDGLHLNAIGNMIIMNEWLQAFGLGGS